METPGETWGLVHAAPNQERTPCKLNPVSANNGGGNCPNAQRSGFTANLCPAEIISGSSFPLQRLGGRSHDSAVCEVKRLVKTKLSKWDGSA